LDRPTKKAQLTANPDRQPITGTLAELPFIFAYLGLIFECRRGKVNEALLQRWAGGR
jgi:hypothetical protein